MYIQQISIFVENRFGSAADVVRALADEGINISALSIADTSDYGIMRLIVDAPEKAIALLQAQGIMVKKTDVLAIPIADQPGGLAYALETLKKGNISIDYMYAFVGRNHGKAMVVSKTDDSEAAARILAENGIIPLTDTDLF